MCKIEMIMKKLIFILLATMAIIPACTTEDVFAPWKDPSKFVIPSDDVYITVVQYNIWGANKGWNSKRFDDIAAVINSQKPDLVSLNEVDSLTNRNKFVMFKELAQRTGMYYAFAAARDPYSYNWNQAGAYGDAILSKYPIEEVRRFKLYPDPEQGDEDREDRAVCAARVKIGDRSVWMVSTHLDHRNYELSRIYQANQFKTIMESLEGPAVVCGDLNAKPESETMNIIRTYLTPQYPFVGPEYYTHPSKYDGQQTPTTLIDYILLKNTETALRCMSYRVVNEKASDHCAVVATFKFVE